MRFSARTNLTIVFLASMILITCLILGHARNIIFASSSFSPVPAESSTRTSVSPSANSSYSFSVPQGGKLTLHWYYPFCGANCGAETWYTQGTLPPYSTSTFNPQVTTNNSQTTWTLQTSWQTNTGSYALLVGATSASATLIPANVTINVTQGVVTYARAIANGQAELGWSGGLVPYSWGGGHGSQPGPSYGTCSGYTGPLPCHAPQTLGVDCSGFTRWVYYLAYGKDILGSGNTNNQLQLLQKVTAPQPGDLVFFGSSATNTSHVGIYIGSGHMIDSPRTNKDVRIDKISTFGNVVGYYHYNG